MESKTTTPESDSSSSFDPCTNALKLKRGWMNKIFGTSPRPSICGAGGDSEVNLEDSVQLEKLEKIGFVFLEKNFLGLTRYWVGGAV